MKQFDDAAKVIFEKYRNKYGSAKQVKQQKSFRFQWFSSSKPMIDPGLKDVVYEELDKMVAKGLISQDTAVDFKDLPDKALGKAYDEFQKILREQHASLV